MKNVNVVVISIILFLSVGVTSAVNFYFMDDIITDDCTPEVEFTIVNSNPCCICKLIIDGIPYGEAEIYDNVLSSITCNRPLKAGLYVYYISAYDSGFYNSSSYTLQTSSSNYPASPSPMVEAIGHLGDGFQHLGNSIESIFLWGTIFCAIVILLGMIGMFMKALRG